MAQATTVGRAARNTVGAERAGAAPTTRLHETLHQALVEFIRRTATARFVLPDGTSLERSAYAVLHRLTQSGPRRGSDLSLDLGLDLSTVSRQLAALVHRGLVRKVADPDDGRATLVSLTPAGVEFVTHKTEARNAWVAAALADWTDSDLATFAGLLTRFSDDVFRPVAPGPLDIATDHR